MWVLILFALFAVVVCIMAFIRGASSVNGEERRFLDAGPDVHRGRDRDVA